MSPRLPGKTEADTAGSLEKAPRRTSASSLVDPRSWDRAPGLHWRVLGFGFWGFGSRAFRVLGFRVFRVWDFRV